MKNEWGRLARLVDTICSPVVEHKDHRHHHLLKISFSRAIRQRSLYHLFLALRFAFHMALGVGAMPLGYVLRRLGFRFLLIDLTQIGSIMFLDLYLRQWMVESGKRAKRTFVCRSDFRDPNPAALDLYASSVTYVKNPLLKLLLSGFFMDPFSGSRVFDFETRNSFYRPDQERSVRVGTAYAGYFERHRRPLIALTGEQIATGRRQSAPYIDHQRPLMTLHVRDPGYYGDVNRPTRSADIATYEHAIALLIDRGFTVVRMGDPAMVTIDGMIERCGPALVDYARSDWRSDFLDCYLISQSSFFLGCASGLWAIAAAFDIPCCNVNFYTASTCLGFSPKDLSIFKKFRYRGTDELVPFEEIMRPPFCSNPSLEVLEEHGCWLEDNTSQEIYDTVLEFIDRPTTDASDLQNAAKKMLLPGNWSYMSLGNFAEAFLRQYLTEEEERDVCDSLPTRPKKQSTAGTSGSVAQAR